MRQKSKWNVGGRNGIYPRIPLITNIIPSQFKRIQFPVSVYLAVGINKSQGQIKKKTTGVDLRTNIFNLIKCTLLVFA